ncbi:MAG: dienelactone hydrolase [Candidatus Melainabacteria bacterium HGW-Melainabacteria-1]|nr:MAG: dienelactone hydrolase [Candidatus Melainabacteria bacterium HGW-Melainabacteria-1]
MAAGLICLALLSGLPAEAKLVSRDVDYQHQGQAMQGYLVYDDALVKPGKTPGILVFHAWMGIGSHERQWANQLAELGYIAFAPDIYGHGIRPNTPQTAGAEAGKYRADRALMRARAQAGLERLQLEPMADPGQIGAIGFCFGGGVALELARSGAALQGVVSLHGNLDTPHTADAKQIKGAVLVLHGADDPFVKDEQVHGFVQEMRAAGIEWQLNAYGGAVHAFTDPQAGNDPKTGAAYAPKLAKRAWQETTHFFANLFGS